MKSFGKNFGLLVVVILFAYFVSPVFVSLEKNLFGGGGSWTDVGGIFGLILAFIFFVVFLYEAFGAKGKYWWMGVLLIPALAFEVYFDLEHIYAPVLLGVIGWAVGFAVTKLLGGRASQ